MKLSGHDRISKPYPKMTRADALANRNPYSVWISEYAGEPYQAVAEKAVTQLDSLADRYMTSTRQDELIAIFREATRLEEDFWEMGWSVGRERA